MPEYRIEIRVIAQAYDLDDADHLAEILNDRVKNLIPPNWEMEYRDPIEVMSKEEEARCASM